MSSRIKNLENYNKARIDLRNVGENLDILHRKIGATAVAKAASILLIRYTLCKSKGRAIFQKEKKLIKNEPDLKNNLWKQ